MLLHLLCFFFFFIISATTSELCLESHCNGDYQTIKFPFRIENLHPKSCGYPGFDLSCHATTSSQPLLHLPSSGNFSVQFIDYKSQEIRINDPNNCLPRKILSLNLSGSPFLARNTQKLTFFNCSLDYIPPKGYGVDPIECLSSSSYSVFAVSSPMLVNTLSSSSKCAMMKNVSVPFASYYSSKLRDDLVLGWEHPNCRRCESLGRRCEIESNSSNIVPCLDISPVSRPGKPGVAANVVSIAIGMVGAVLCLLGLLCCFCIKVNSRSGTHNSSNEAHWTQTFWPTTNMGLDGPTIDSYPKFELDESLSIPKPNDNICPICLAQYRPKEIVKSIPNCQHCFHQCCIDEWLRLKASCPVCRKSPTESPPSDPS